MDLPAGIHNYTYAEDMAIVRTKTHWSLLILLLILIFTAPLYWAPYLVHLANLIGITLVAVIGLNILTGYCGQLSIGHAGFVAVGAYTSAVLTGTFELPFLVGLIGAGFASGIVGLIFGIPSVRIKGFYLAITTLAAQFIIIWVIKHWRGVTGGVEGMVVPYASIAGFTLKTEANWFYLIMVVTIICIFFAKNLARTRVGRAFIAIRDNDLAAEVMGVNLWFYKLLAFFIGCFLAGIAGSLLGHWVGMINADQFTLKQSILYVGMVIVGGMGTALGPIAGVLFFRLLEQGAFFLCPILDIVLPAMPRGFSTGVPPILYGLAIILFIIFEPRGLAHRWSLFKSAYRLWPFSYW